MSQRPTEINKPENKQDSTEEFLKKTKELFDLENNQSDTPTPTSVSSLSSLASTTKNNKVFRFTTEESVELKDEKESVADSNPSNIVGFPKRS